MNIDENYNKIVLAITTLSEVEQELRYSVSPRIVLETAVIKTITKVSLEERLEKLENLVSGGGAFITQEKVKPEVKKTEIVKEETKEFCGIDDGNLLGKLLGHLRDHKDMSLLACVRQVKKVCVSNNVVDFYLDDQMTIDVIMRDKYKPVLNAFFDNLGLKYNFKAFKEVKQADSFGALSSAFGGRLEIKE